MHLLLFSALFKIHIRKNKNLKRRGTSCLNFSKFNHHLLFPNFTSTNKFHLTGLKTCKSTVKFYFRGHLKMNLPIKYVQLKHIKNLQEVFNARKFS